MPLQVCKPVNPGAIGNLRVNGGDAGGGQRGQRLGGDPVGFLVPAIAGGLADSAERLRAGEGNVRDDQPPAGLAVPETQSWLVDTENTIVCLKPEKLAGF